MTNEAKNFINFKKWALKRDGDKFSPATEYTHVVPTLLTYDFKANSELSDQSRSREPMKSDPYEKEVTEFLLDFKGERCDLLRFPGNYGDALIWHGTQTLLRKADIVFEIIEHGMQPVSKILIVDGGGNLVDYYSDVKDFLNTNGQWYAKVIILPHTIAGVAALECLNSLGKRLTVFCREIVTYNTVKYSLLEAEVYLWRDCAFYVQLPSTLPPQSIEAAELRAFRTDMESIFHKVPEDNRDLCLEGDAMSPIDHMLSVLRSYKRIQTDRLPIAVACALLGCDVELYPNSYYKNRAAYDYSLRGFSNVKFVSGKTFEALSSSLSKNNFMQSKKGINFPNQKIDSGQSNLGERKQLMIECSFGEVMDKVTILMIKEQHISDKTVLLNIRSEIISLRAAWSDAGLPSMESMEGWEELKKINQRLWGVEDDLRALERSKNFGPDFVQLARQVYLLNDRRAIIKRTVNEKQGSPFIEYKSYS